MKETKKEYKVTSDNFRGLPETIKEEIVEKLTEQNYESLNDDTWRYFEEDVLELLHGIGIEKGGGAKLFEANEIDYYDHYHSSRTNYIHFEWIDTYLFMDDQQKEFFDYFHERESYCLEQGRGELYLEEHSSPEIRNRKKENKDIINNPYYKKLMEGIKEQRKEGEKDTYHYRRLREDKEEWKHTRLRKITKMEKDEFLQWKTEILDSIRYHKDAIFEAIVYEAYEHIFEEIKDEMEAKINELHDELRGEVDALIERYEDHRYKEELQRDRIENCNDLDEYEDVHLSYNDEENTILIDVNGSIVDYDINWYMERRGQNKEEIDRLLKELK